MQYNKLLNKYVLPERIATIAFIGVTGLSAVLLGKIINLSNEIERDYQEKLESNPHAKKNMLGTMNPLLCIVLIVVGGIFAFNTMNITIEKKEKAYKLGNKYLKSLLKKAYEQNDEQTKAQVIDAMGKFEQLSKDPQALSAVITAVCNSLSQSEQREILKIAKNFDSLPTDENSKKNAAKTRNEILKIVKNHESTDPEFLPTILNAFDNAHKTYVFPVNGRTR